MAGVWGLVFWGFGFGVSDLGFEFTNDIRFVAHCCMSGKFCEVHSSGLRRHEKEEKAEEGQIRITTV